MTASKRLLTTKEVAEIFGCEPLTVKRWAKRGLLSRVRVGGLVRYRAEDVDQLIDGSATTSDEPLAEEVTPEPA